MGIDFEFEEARRLLRTRLWGTVTREDLRGYLERIAADDRIQGAILELVDMSRVETLEVDAGGVEEVVKADQAAAGRRSKRMAIVATREVSFGLARMYALMGEATGSPIDVRVYRDRLPAERWLLGTR